MTNGVHGPTWEAREMTELLGDAAARRRAPTAGPEPSDRDAVGPARPRCARRLVEEVRRRVREAWLQRGASVPELGWTESTSSTRTC